VDWVRDISAITLFVEDLAIQQLGQALCGGQHGVPRIECRQRCRQGHEEAHAWCMQCVQTAQVEVAGLEHVGHAEDRPEFALAIDQPVIDAHVAEFEAGLLGGDDQIRPVEVPSFARHHKQRDDAFDRQLYGSPAEIRAGWPAGGRGRCRR